MKYSTKGFCILRLFYFLNTTEGKTCIFFRKVKETEGEEFAQSLSMCHFVETSAAESYAQVERAFKIVFRLVQAYSRSSLPPPTNGLGRIGRKNSWSQMAHLIRDHYKKQLAPNQNQSCPIEKKFTSTYDPVQYDKNNNFTKLNPTQRRMRKNSTLGFSHTPLPLCGNPKLKLKSRCLSLTTLNEDQCDQSTPHLNKSNTCQDVNESSPKGSESSESAKLSVGDNSESGNAITKMSLSSDDTLELSDFSTPDEDAFLPETFNQASKDGAKNKSSSDKSQEPVKSKRKPSINKKNLKICIHSDDEFEEKALGDFNEAPPVSAPIIRSNSSNRFRFFPNSLNENQDLLKTLHGASKGIVPSPLLGAIETQAMRSPKDEKRSPSYNFIKHFFKGSRHSSLHNCSCGTSQTLTGPLSSRSMEHASNSPTEAKSIISLLCDEHQDLKHTPDQEKAIFVRTSSSSLSSVLSNDEAELETLGSPGSFPSSPKVNKSSLHVKVRRPSIRDAVGILIRKRKQSMTNDITKHSKEQVF